MDKSDVSKLKKALCLKRNVMGVRFLYYKHNYDELDLPEYGKKNIILCDGQICD